MADQAHEKSEIPAESARELLTRERQRVESALADLGRQISSEIAEVDNEQSSDDDAETIVEEEVDGAVARSLRVELEAIERAEQRLEDGTYGVSIESGDPIPAKRLEHVPYAERTIGEQERRERTGGR
jgi:DnaK suppressor protein